MSAYKIIDNQIIYTILPEDDGISLRNILRRLRLSRAALHRFKSNAAILINGSMKRANEQVFAGDVLTISLEDSSSSNIIPVKGSLEIIFEDSAFLAVNKSPGMPTHPSWRHLNNTLANYIAGYLPENSPVHFINRLDKDTSGIVLLAKNAYYKQFLAAHTRSIQKTYLALAQGHFLDKASIVDAPIARETPDHIRRCVREDGQQAQTSYTVLQEFPDYSALEVLLHTGRTHQIRVHLAHIGHPLLGDDMYDGDTRMIQRQALHAWKLSFPHPLTHSQVQLTVPPPEDISCLYSPE